jgi:signal transduction histidine kinase
MLTFLRHSLLLIVLYVTAAWIGTTYSNLAPSNLSVLWLPSGIAIVGLVVLGWRALPIIAIGSLLFHMQTQSDSLTHLLSLTLLDTIQPAIGTWMYQRVCPHGCLSDEKSFIRFLLGVAMLPPLLTSWAVILSIQSSGNVVYESATELLRAIGNTTVSDTLGILIVIPLYDALLGAKNRSAGRRDIIEFIALLSFLILVLIWVSSSRTLRPIVILIPMTLLALRNGVIGSSIGFAVSAITMIIATVHGYGPFLTEELQTEFLGLITVLISIGLPVHLIAINVRNMKIFAVTLEHRVDERTSELKQKEARLLELNQDKDRLMSIIGHDLRNPIQGIIGLGELVVGDVRNKTYADLESYGVMIQGSARQTLQLLQNLLDWSATQSGRIRFNPQPTDVSRLLSEALHVVADPAKAKGITLKVDVEMGLTASVDKQMMATILRNLVSNSLKFTFSGGTILTSAHSTERGFRLSVTDTGVGMTEEQIEALEGPLSNLSTHGTEGEPGSGLGLLLVNDFTHKHGGTVRIESELGRGTTFELDFPAKP